MVDKYSVFSGNWQKVWAYFTGKVSTLESKKCEKISLIQVHFDIYFLIWVKDVLTFWLAFSDQILKFIIFVRILAKLKEKKIEIFFLPRSDPASSQA